MSRQRIELQSPPERWRKRFSVAGSVLLVAIAFTASLSLAAEPRVRAGVVRRVRFAQTKIASKPTPTVKLRVPFLKQEHALSCEVATLRMALVYRGTGVTEADLLKAVGFDPAPRRRSNNILIWGDPDASFVGDVDGVMPRTGYGVHAGPIGRVAGQYRRAEVITSGTAATLADAVANGNPVITWGHLGNGKPIRWQTLGGKQIRAVDGEHTRVVIGYAGTREDPTGFFVMDPIYGEQYWKTEKFMENWEKLGRTGVVVY
ncbi:C39 family peptidase [Candidatus Uhrbacteria bacterium]|nr:C39 family peptidase [Candidatus Uhrbacteria bacterium]